MLRNLRIGLALRIAPELAQREVARQPLVATPAVARGGDLYTLIKLMADHSGRSVSTVANWAGGHSRLGVRLENGRGCNTRTANRLVVWLSENWPSDLDWPHDIPRPTPSRKEATK